jgi:hypothetical protein
MAIINLRLTPQWSKVGRFKISNHKESLKVLTSGGLANLPAKRSAAYRIHEF